jgi:anti-anti-sigma factor
MSFHLEVRDGTARIRLTGEVESSEATGLRDAVLAALADGATRVVFLCADLSFIDSSGLNVLAHAARVVQAQGGGVTVVDPRPNLRRLLELTRLDREVEFDPPTPDFQLSNRERDVIQLVADGLSNREIAERLFISQETVKSHLRVVFRKLGVENRTQAARRMLDQTE